MNEKDDLISQTLPKLESLGDVETYLNGLKKGIKSGKISVQNIDFVPIFHSIQTIVNTKNLRNIVTEFENSADLFQRKIEDIRSYISEIGGMEKFEEKLKLNTEDSLENLMNSLYRPPYIVEDINLESLIASFTRLTTKNNMWDSIEFPELTDLVEDAPDIEQFNHLLDDVHFEEELQKFKQYLMTKLPIQLSQLLSETPDEETKNANFIFCLYLIQRKILLYNKKTNELQKYKEERIT